MNSKISIIEQIKESRIKKQTNIQNSNTGLVKIASNSNNQKNKILDIVKSGVSGVSGVVKDDKTTTPLMSSGVSSGVVTTPNSPLTPNNTTLHHTTPLTPKYILTLKQKILFLTINPITITKLSKLLNENIRTISTNLNRKDRLKSLLNLNMIIQIEKEEGVNKYQITEEGQEYLDNLKSKYESEQERKQQEVTIQEYHENKIQSYQDYFESERATYQNMINESQFINIKFKELIMELPEMGEELLDKPDEELKSIQIAFDKVFECENNKVRIIELPKSERLTLGQIRNNHNGKLVSIPATVISYSDIMPLTKTIRCECPGCGTIVSVLQQGKLIKEPKQCGCGRKGKFRIISTSCSDCQVLKVEELPELLGIRTQQSQMKAVLEDGLCDYKYQHYYQESNPIVFNCIIRQEPVKENSTMNILYLEVHSIEMDKSLKEVKINPSDIEEIEKFSQKNPLKKIISYIAPEIIERDMEKKGLMLCLLSGGQKRAKKRDDSHVLMVGDPSLGKSTLIKSLHTLYPLGRWVSGKSSSGVGLTGSVKKDKATEDVMVVKGALALANGSVVFCDELDKMHTNDRDALHEPMENQDISIDKYNKHVKLQTDTGLIAAANPKYGRFDSNSEIIKQIDLPPTLISRFDLIFAMLDKPNQEKDKKTADAIMDSFDEQEPEKDELDFIRKYIYYCRNKISPKLTKETKEQFIKYYVNLRGKSMKDGRVHITARQLEGLVRLAKANAKVNLRTETNNKDAKMALSIMKYSYESLGVTTIDEVETGMGYDMRDKFTVFDTLFDSLKDKDNKVTIMDLSDKYKEYDIVVPKLLERGNYMQQNKYLVKVYR